MAAFTLDERTRLSIELALTVDNHDVLEREQQDGEGRRLGMTGAELDVARSGGSFDVYISAAIGLALAVITDDITKQEQQRARASRIGISRDVCAEIDTLARRYRQPSLRKTKRHA